VWRTIVSNRHLDNMLSTIMITPHFNTFSTRKPGKGESGRTALVKYSSDTLKTTEVAGLVNIFFGCGKKLRSRQLKTTYRFSSSVSKSSVKHGIGKCGEVKPVSRIEQAGWKLSPGFDVARHEQGAAR
jgi:hypothetical protein